MIDATCGSLALIGILAGCGGRAATSGDDDLATLRGATEVRCYAGSGTWDSVFVQSHADFHATLKRTVAPSFHAITEEWQRDDRSEIRDLVVDESTFTIRIRGDEYEGTGNLYAGEPWQWTSWDLNLPRDGDSLFESYELTPAGIDVTGALGTFETTAMMKLTLDAVRCR